MEKNDIALGIFLVVLGLFLILVRKPLVKEIVNFNRKFLRIDYSERNASIVLITVGLFFCIMGILNLFGLL
jgi:uncharacterized membrane protein